MFPVPVPEDENYHRQVRPNPRKADVFFICQIDPHEIVLAVSGLGVIQADRCNLVRPQGLFTEKALDEQNIAVHVQGLGQGEGYIGNERAKDQKEKHKLKG